MSTHNICFEQKYEKYHFSENFQFLVVNFAIYLNRRVFVMDQLLLQQKNNNGPILPSVRSRIVAFFVNIHVV